MLLRPLAENPYTPPESIIPPRSYTPPRQDTPPAQSATSATTQPDSVATSDQQIPQNQVPTKQSAQSVLEGLGLIKPKSAAPPTTTEILEDNNLTVKATLEQLGNIIQTSQSESIQIQAIKMLMEMHQLLKPQVANGGLVVTINIVDSEAPRGLNPILIPRAEPNILDMSILPQNVETHAV